MKYTNLTAAPEKVGGSEEGSRNVALRCASPWFSEVGTAADTSPLKMLSSDVDDEEARRRSAPGISRAAYVEGSQAGSTRIKPAARAPSSAPASPSPSPILLVTAVVIAVHITAAATALTIGVAAAAFIVTEAPEPKARAIMTIAQASE